jgi:hypothetical protein
MGWERRGAPDRGPGRGGPGRRPGGRGGRRRRRGGRPRRAGRCGTPTRHFNASAQRYVDVNALMCRRKKSAPMARATPPPLPPSRPRSKAIRMTGQILDASTHQCVHTAPRRRRGGRPGRPGRSGGGGSAMQGGEGGRGGGVGAWAHAQRSRAIHSRIAHSPTRQCVRAPPMHPRIKAPAHRRASTRPHIPPDTVSLPPPIPHCLPTAIHPHRSFHPHRWRPGRASAYGRAHARTRARA